MAAALYHPEHGYYGPGPRRLGRSGDFYTAVSVGPLYGRLLAALAEETWQKLGRPADFTLIEQAAHDGQLAEDLAAACEFPIVIVEPNPRYEAVQRQRLASLGERVRWVASVGEISAVPALYLCNELPDAMPCHRLGWSGLAWEELYVVLTPEGGLEFQPGPLSTAALEAEAATLPTDLPPGHILEVNLAALEWMRELAAAPFHGGIFLADYGLDEEEFWLPSRANGTLRRYQGHQMDDQVLEDLGRCDLTSHVNFTRLLAEAGASGLRVQAYEHQGRFLGRLGLAWLRSLDGRPPDAAAQALLRQYQSLTHPAFMGRSFRVALLEK